MLTETLHTAFFYSGNKRTPAKLHITVAGETALSGRELCEDFAPRNEATRVSGERGANRAARAPALGRHFRISQPVVRAREPKTKA